MGIIFFRRFITPEPRVANKEREILYSYGLKAEGAKLCESKGD